MRPDQPCAQTFVPHAGFVAGLQGVHHRVEQKILVFAVDQRVGRTERRSQDAASASRPCRAASSASAAQARDLSGKCPTERSRISDLLREAGVTPAGSSRTWH